MQLVLAQMIGRTAASTPPPATYDTWVATFAADLVSYWKFEGDGTDEQGVEDATINGSPETGVETIVDLDAGGECIAWPGTAGVYAEAAHNSAHKTAAGTIVITFQCDTLATKSTLLSADDGSAAGGFSIEVTTAGEPRAFLRRQSDATPVIVMGNAGDVNLSAAYTMILKWGTGGLSLALWTDAGALLRRAEDALTDGVTGTSTLHFGIWRDEVQSPHAGPYGRVIWLDRRISDAEEANLARANTISRSSAADAYAVAVTGIDDPRGWWRFADQSPDQLLDSSGNAYHGTYSSGEYITTPEAHGWSGANTVEQNSDILRTAVANAAANAGSSSTGRGVVEFVQQKTYVVRPNGDANGTRTNSSACMTLPTNVEIRTAGKPTIASGNQAILQFESWNGKTGVTSRSIIKALGTGVYIGWITVHGNKNTCTSGDPDNVINYTGEGQNGGIYNILMDSGATNYTLKEVLSTHGLVDCFVTRDKDDAGGAEPYGLVEDCIFTRGRRQGASIIHMGSVSATWDQSIFRRVEFSDTGDYPGDVKGAKPGWGCDIEPDQAGVINGLTFDDCDFDGNLGSDWENGNFNSGSAQGIGLGYSCRSTVNYAKVINCRMTNNSFIGLQLGQRDNPLFDQLDIQDNVLSGNGNSDEIWFTGPGGGRFTNAVFVNNDPSEFRVRPFFSPPYTTGWDVDIWKGDYGASYALVFQVAVTTITAHDGFPP